jgi:hypothetical protein
VLENSRLKELEERLAKREEAETAREFVRGFAKKVGLSNEEYSILRENKTFTKVLKESLKLSNKKINLFKKFAPNMQAICMVKIVHRWLQTNLSQIKYNPNFLGLRRKKTILKT